MADTHIGRSIPLAIAEHRRKAFNRAFRRAVEEIVKEGVDYVFICGDLFERRTLRPRQVQFAHDELYRLARETEERHGKGTKILLIRGNHDGRPQSDTLDYLKHPLADYLHVFEDDDPVFDDGRLYVVGLNYHDRLDAAYKRIAKPALEKGSGTKVLMLHGFIRGYNPVPPYTSSLTMDQLAETEPAYVFSGHHHEKGMPKRLSNGGWLVTPGSLEMYDFAEEPEKGFYMVETGEEPRFRWVSIEPAHHMKQVIVRANRKRPATWFSDRITEALENFTDGLREKGKPGYIRIRVEGSLSEGWPSDIDLDAVEKLREREPLLLWMDLDAMDLELPPLAVRPTRSRVEVEEFFRAFGDFAGDITDMHGEVRDALEEKASLTTGLLTGSDRAPLVQKWVERFEARRFRREEE